MQVPRHVYISSINGHYVTEQYARANPDTTVRYRQEYDPMPRPVDFGKLMEALKYYQNISKKR